jgi:predicted ATPase
VTGPAGTGKTRVSLEAAERLAEPFAGAVYFTALADLNDFALIPGAILDSLGVPRSPQQEPLEQTVEALAKKPTLLVLDNFEHLMEGGADVVQTLLTRVSSLKLLVTSRQRLGLSAEREFILSPLPVPGSEASPERLSLYESVQLFLDRAQQVMPYFQVNHANAAAVAGLVGGLEGIPLAIELAAARIQVLTPAQMLSQLSHRLDFLARRKRDVAERQRTLRGALEWSYRLLAPELQRFFSRLSVFRGGWRAEAAEQVCKEPLALDYLEQLRECSLVFSAETEDGVFRFRMLETLREFAAEQISESRRDDVREAGEEEACRARHARFFLHLAERAELELKGPAQAEWLRRLEEEHDNCRAALEYFLTRGASEEGLRLGGALGWFWWMRGYLSEGRERLQALLTPSFEAEQRHVQPARVKALYLTGMLADDQGDIEAARALFQESLTLARELGDQPGAAIALNCLGGLARHAHNVAAARALFEESLAISRAIGDRWWTANALNNLSRVVLLEREYATARDLVESALAIQRELQDRRVIARSLTFLGIIRVHLGDHEGARVLQEESLAIVRELGVSGQIEDTLGALADAAYERGDEEAAQSWYEERLALAREMGSAWAVAESLYYLGLVARNRGEGSRAATLWSESLVISRRLGDKNRLSECLEGLASMALPPAHIGSARTDRGSHESQPRSEVPVSALRAARLYGAAAALREVVGAPGGVKQRAEYERHLADARALRDSGALAAAWEEGRAMSLDQAIDLALASSEG